MHEKIAKDFEPTGATAAVGKAIKDFNEGKTSKSAEKQDEKKKVDEAKDKHAEKKMKKDLAKIDGDKKELKKLEKELAQSEAESVKEKPH